MINRVFLCAFVFSLATQCCVKANKARYAQRTRSSLHRFTPIKHFRKCPTIAEPLNWDQDPWLPDENSTDAAQRLAIPSLTQPFYNEVNDVRATVSAKDVELIFSTNGNWRSALARLLNEVYFNPAFVSKGFASPTTKFSYLLTTSPPISIAQLENGRVKVGNVMYVDAEPHLVVAPGAVLNALRDRGLTDDSTRTAIISTFGNVILKRRKDRSIRTFWDLKKVKPGRFASSDPAEEGSFNNYRSSVFEIAFNNPEDPSESEDVRLAEATALQARLFDSSKGVATIGPPMHNSVPHVIANGEADAGLIFLHLAVTAMRNNPGVFSAIFLASDKAANAETDDPDVLAMGQDPLVGNRVGTFSYVFPITEVSAKQEAARASFVSALESDEFTTILKESGLRRSL